MTDRHNDRIKEQLYIKTKDRQTDRQKRNDFDNLKLNSNPQCHTDHMQTHSINKLTLKTRDVH